MIDPGQIQKQNRDLTRLAGQKFSFEAETLEKAMKKSGRRLPRRAHKQAKVLFEAERLAGHPKLTLMLDAEKIAKAQAALRTALEQIDPKDRRKGMVLSTLGLLSFNLIVVFALLVAILLWRGFL